MLKVIHEDGQLVRNSTEYRLADPEAGYIYEAGETVRIKRSKWAEGQPALQVAPEASAEPGPESDVPKRARGR